MKIQKHVKVELMRKKAARPIEAVQYDTGNQVIFEIIDFDLPTGTKATLYIQKPSGKFVYQEDEITIAGNNITVNLHNQALTEHGKVYYQVRIENGADLISTFAGLMLIDKSLADAGATESRTVLSAFAELTAEKIAEIQAAAAEEIAQIRAVANEKADALTMEATANPAQCFPDEGSILRPVLTFNPIQAGSGDPYPAGGGVNLVPFAVTGSTYSNAGVSGVFDGSGVLVNGTPTTDYTKLVNQEISLPPGTYHVSGGEFSKAYLQVSTSHADGTAKHYSNASFVITGDETRVQVMIQTGTSATVGTLKDYRFCPMLVAGSDAPAEYAPYSNIRPITGRTGAVLTRCGKNLLDMRGAVGGTSNGITAVVNADGSFHISGTASSADINIWFRGNYGLTSPLFTLQPGTYYVKNVVLFNNTTALGGLYSGGVLTLNAATPVTGVRCVSLNAGQSFDMTVYPAIYSGNSDQEWQPYQGDTYAINFGQTVYGCKVDVNKGEMVVTEKYKAANGVDEGWELSGKYFNSWDMARESEPVTNVPMMCSHFKTITYSQGDAGETGANMSQGGLRVYAPGLFPTIDAWKEYLAAQYAAGTPVQIAYKLANPITISLTPQQITALQGLNTLYTDADGLTVGYNKSLNKAFEEALARIAALESAAVNNV